MLFALEKTLRLTHALEQTASLLQLKQQVSGLLLTGNKRLDETIALHSKAIHPLLRRLEIVGDVIDLHLVLRDVKQAPKLPTTRSCLKQPQAKYT